MITAPGITFIMLLVSEPPPMPCNEKNGPGKKWPARAIFFCKNWPGHVMEPESDMTDGEGFEEALDDAAYEYLTTDFTLMDAVNLGSDASGRKRSVLLWKITESGKM